MSHQDSLVDFCFSEPAGLLCSKKHFHCYLFATPLSHPDFSIATFSNLLHHLNLLCDGPLNLWNAKADLIPCPVEISVFTSLLLCLLPTQPAQERVEYAEYAAIVTWISATLYHCGRFPSSPGRTAGWGHSHHCEEAFPCKLKTHYGLSRNWISLCKGNMFLWTLKFLFSCGM